MKDIMIIELTVQSDLFIYISLLQCGVQWLHSIVHDVLCSYNVYTNTSM